ncbi:hypothetical protein H072_3100 [Dactylellina haptotyla CBS 200.50]|uniref:Uncharacterized protein n=1 Tax=Dactylellina haptotyla (strain CBS 200.50) TaxID=1284197 RepID=S8AIF4_DACHA|nr:hypothetical protein H072_3100 [Dactylellina haptotyla CBS 200.50]
MCIQDFTLYQCGCQKKGSLRECGEFQCSHIKDIAKQKPDYCQDCQKKLEHGESIPQRKSSTVKRLTRSLSMKVKTMGPGHGRNNGSLEHTPEEDKWVNPFNDPL